MSRILPILLLLGLLAIAAGCSDEITSPVDLSSSASQGSDDNIHARPLSLDDVALPAYGSSAASISFGDVFAFDDGHVAGQAKLMRNDNGVAIKLSTSGLEPGSAATLWWVIWNHPENCAQSPCLDTDFGNPATGVDFGYAAGSIVGGQGTATFAAHLNENDPDGFLFSGLGLQDARAAEVHAVVRTHGPAVPELINDQLHSFMGGCMPGEANEGLCEDLQAVILRVP